MASDASLKKRCFVNAPFVLLEARLSHFISAGIQPEIGLEGDVLYSRGEREFRRVAEALDNAGLACTLHAPFFELSIGALDPFIRKASRDKMRRALELIPLFRPRSVVCHLGFEENKHGYKEKEWFALALEGWQGLLAIAEKEQTPLLLENTYETTPRMHKQMLSALGSPLACFCFDCGHVLAFAKNRWQEWLPELAPWLGQLHLHDNHGSRDDHLAIGQGIFPFAELFGYLKQEGLSPILTMEPHQEEGIEQSFTALADLL